MKVINRVLSSDFETLEIYPLGDLHLEDKHNDMNAFLKWRNEILEKPNRYVILNGDLLDNATKTSVSDTYSATMTPNEALNRLIDLLEPIKDRILCATEGNHEGRTWRKEGIIITERIARELGIGAYFSHGAYALYVSFGKNKGRENRQSVYSVYGKHGSGGGKTSGSKINVLEAMQGVGDFDIYLHSHTHLGASFKMNFFRSDYRNRQVTEVTHTFVNTNAFLKFGGYGEELGFKPASRDYPKIIMQGYDKEVKVII